MPRDVNGLEKIFGRGQSTVTACSGNGCYILEKKSDNLWELHLHPAQRFLTDPQRGRQFKSMANRWISCIKEAPVSQLLEDMLEFSFFISPLQKVTSLSANKDFPLKDMHTVNLPSGDYLLTLKADK